MPKAQKAAHRRYYSDRSFLLSAVVSVCLLVSHVFGFLGDVGLVGGLGVSLGGFLAKRISEGFSSRGEKISDRENVN